MSLSPPPPSPTLASLVPPQPLPLTPDTSSSPNFSTTLFIAILFIYVFLGFSLEARKKLGQWLWLHESGPAIVLGALLGLAVANTSGGNHVLEISDTTFFYFVLPPIIFAQGFGLKKRNFFRYFHYITAFGIIGTFIQFGFMTFTLFKGAALFNITLNESPQHGSQLTLQESMIISACLAAADEVSALSLIKSTEYPKLSAVLFGEGVINDAVSILLFHSVVTADKIGNVVQHVATNETAVNAVAQHALGAARFLVLGKSSSSDDDDTSVDDDDGTDDPYTLKSDTLSPTPAYTYSPTSAPTVSPDHHSHHLPALINYWDVKIWAILSTTFKTLLFAIVIGVGTGLIIARLLKVYPTMEKSPVHQTAIFALGAYMSFCVSDALEYSGVLTVFFSGLTLSHYAYHSLSEDAKKSTKITFATLSQIAEAYCFAAVGVSTHRLTDLASVSWKLIVLALVTLLLGRAITIFGICGVGKCVFPNQFQMPMKEQGVLYFGGLIRGAICWAQVIQVRHVHRHIMLSTTLAVILFTTLVIGSLLPMALRALKVDEGSGEWHAESPLRGAYNSTNDIRVVPGETVGLLLEGEDEGDEAGVPPINRVTGGSAYQYGSVEERRSERHDDVDDERNASIIRNFDTYVMKPVFGGKRRRNRSKARRMQEEDTGGGEEVPSRGHATFGQWNSEGTMSPIDRRRTDTESLISATFSDDEGAGL